MSKNSPRPPPADHDYRLLEAETGEHVG